jgi:tRNA G18 (ribose-2'-O)-methylase SpoU
VLIRIDTPDDPRLADYRDLTDAQLRAREHRGEHAHFIAEGEGVVRHLLASRFPLRSLLLTPAFAQGRFADVIHALDPAIPVLVAQPAVMEAIAGFPFHRGVLASGQRLPDQPLDTLLAQAKLLVVCEDLANIENVGSVFRNLACMVEDAAVLLTPRSCHPLYRKALRVSMGHALRIPFATLPDWPASIRLLHEAGFTTLALTPRAEAVSLRDLPPSPRHAILLGSEGPGLQDATIAAASRQVRIPMTPGSDSLNVATALAVALWQCGR